MSGEGPGAGCKEDGRNDQELWQDLQQGRREALEALVRRYHGSLWAYAWRCTRDYHVAQDLVQETFMALLEKGHTVQRPAALKRWLYRVLTRRILDWQKAAARRERAAGDAPTQPPEPAMGWERVISLVEVLEGREQRQQVWRALQQLPPAQRAVVVLRFYHDLSLPEIADIMGTPVGTVKSRLHYGLRALYAQLQEEAGATSRRPRCRRRAGSPGVPAGEGQPQPGYGEGSP